MIVTISGNNDIHVLAKITITVCKMRINTKINDVTVMRSSLSFTAYGLYFFLALPIARANPGAIIAAEITSITALIERTLPNTSMNALEENSLLKNHKADNTNAVWTKVFSTQAMMYITLLNGTFLILFKKSNTNPESVPKIIRGKTLTIGLINKTSVGDVGIITAFLSLL